MIAWIRVMQQRWFVIPWLLAFALASVSCEGPHSVTRPPIARNPEISTPPVRGEIVYKPGMSGLIEKTMALVKEQQDAYKQSKVSTLDTLVFKQMAEQTGLEHQRNLRVFDNLAQEMKVRGLSAEMLQRLQSQRQEYESQYQHFSEYLQRLTQTDRAISLRVVDLDRFATFLEAVKPQPHQTPLDVNQLPYARLAPVQRPPMMDTASYAKSFGLPEMPEITPIAAPTADDLAETKEVQLTQGIKDLAKQLDNPLAIYKWVYDNIEFSPTYGSIQGADHCRMSRKCNAFDAASLLIALLRAQKIAARYVFGTIEVPIERARNWVGRFDDKSGALVGRALASGGIPATSIISGGKPLLIRLEHVWVEAWIDYVPSRGRIHQEGDTWIPMDPSFKQHTYAPFKVDLDTTTGVDMSKAIDDSKKTVTSDSLDAITQGPDSKVLQDALSQAGTKIDSVVQSKDFTYEQIKGSKKIDTFAHDLLLASLPYDVKVIGQRLAEMPDRLRHYLNIGVVTQVAPQGPWGFGGDPSPDFQHKISLPEIAGKKLALAYTPASTADQQAVEKYINATQGDLNKLPKSLPSVIQFKPHIMLDSQSLVSGKACRLGADNRFNITVTGPGINKLISNTVPAGGYHAIVVHHGAIATEFLTTIQKQARDLRQQFQDKKVTTAQREEIYGAYLYTAGLNYWVQQDRNNEALAARMGILDIRQPAVGLFSYDLSVTYSGFLVASPQSVSSGGMSTDIDHDPHAIVSYQDDSKVEVRYFSATGINASAWEASVWELMLRPRSANPSNGVSATHMMVYAAQTKIPIYSIRKSNISSILPKLSLTADTINDIKSAVAAGKTVVVPEKQMTKGKWKGVGYIVTDDQSGAGAYMISGGKSGGGNDEDGGCGWCLSFLAGILMIGAGIFAGGAFAIALAVLGILAAAIDLFSAYQQIDNSNLDADQKSMIKGLAQMMFGIGVALAVLGIWFGAVASFVAIAIYFLVVAILVSAIIGALISIGEAANNRNRELDNL